MLQTCHVANCDMSYKFFVFMTLLYNYIMKCSIMPLESDFIHKIMLMSTIKTMINNLFKESLATIFIENEKKNCQNINYFFIFLNKNFILINYYLLF